MPIDRIIYIYYTVSNTIEGGNQMITHYYAIYDKVAEETSNLFPARNDEHAWRMFKKFIYEGRDKDPNLFNELDYKLMFLCSVDVNLCHVHISETESLASREVIGDSL